MERKASDYYGAPPINKACPFLNKECLRDFCELFIRKGRYTGCAIKFTAVHAIFIAESMNAEDQRKEQGSKRRKRVL